MMIEWHSQLQIKWEKCVLPSSLKILFYVPKKKERKEQEKRKKNIYNVEIMMVIKMIATIYYANEW